MASLRDAATSLDGLEVSVFAISRDDVSALAAFAKSENLTTPLLSDPSGEALTRLGAQKPGAKYPSRITFVVDPEGKLRHVFDKVNVSEHGAEVVALIRGLRESGGDTGLTGALDEASFKALHELKDGESPSLKGRTIALGEDAAYLSLPEGATGPLPGLVVIHEWWGLNNHVKHWTDRLAALGYAALAVDLYRGTEAKTREEAMAAMGSVDDARARATIAAALSFLEQAPGIQAPRTGVIGWCFGGAWSLQTAMLHPELDAAVIYYGRLQTDPVLLRPIKAQILGVFGNQDTGIPKETVNRFEAALGEAQVSHRILRYDAHHAFANPSSARYQAEAAEAAWTEVREFLKKHLQ